MNSMKIAAIIVRVLMSLLYLFSVANFLFQFMPMPELGEDAGKFVMGMAASVYLFPLVKIVEFLCAVALLTGRFVPLALVILFPIVVNIVLYHAFLAPEAMGMPIFLMAGHLFLAYYYRDRYSAMVAV